MLWCVMPGKVTVSCRQVSASALALSGVDGRRDQGDTGLEDLSLPQSPSAPSSRQDSMGTVTSSNQLSTLFLQAHDQDHDFLGCVPAVIATGRSCPGQMWCGLGNGC